MLCLLQLDTTLLLALCVAAAIFATGAARLAGQIKHANTQLDTLQTIGLLAPMFPSPHFSCV
jgi:hypothetical protein